MITFDIWILLTLAVIIYWMFKTTKRIIKLEAKCEQKKK